MTKQQIYESLVKIADEKSMQYLVGAGTYDAAIAAHNAADCAYAEYRAQTL